MKRLCLSMIVLVAFASVAVFAQRAWYRGNVRENIRQLETDTDRFKGSLDRALDHSPLDGTRAEDEINEYVKNFEAATDKLKDRAEDRILTRTGSRSFDQRTRNQWVHAKPSS